MHWHTRPAEPARTTKGVRRMQRQLRCSVESLQAAWPVEDCQHMATIKTTRLLPAATANNFQNAHCAGAACCCAYRRLLSLTSRLMCFG
jgi:hypothetical protein